MFSVSALSFLSLCMHVLTADQRRIVYPGTRLNTGGPNNGVFPSGGCGDAALTFSYASDELPYSEANTKNTRHNGLPAEAARARRPTSTVLILQASTSPNILKGNSRSHARVISWLLPLPGSAGIANSNQVALHGMNRT
ncbi:hypothetical protein E2C01_002349 [Portunus trituberculatus]|uniref:Secreted protein n=1 Tax=Portunus trituberculatus TaxID=210409 RepID=A0A5B7CK55_PORTR|nr:hypothetical protein [Portunus trituberculatus]